MAFAFFFMTFEFWYLWHNEVTCLKQERKSYLQDIFGFCSENHFVKVELPVDTVKGTGTTANWVSISAGRRQQTVSLQHHHI